MTNKHECDICNRDFDNGCSLGAHKTSVHSKENCIFCNKDIASSSIKRHKLSCKKIKNEVAKQCKFCKKDVFGGKIFCDRSCSARFNNSQRGPCSDAQREKVRKANKGRKISERIMKNCEICKISFEDKLIFKRTHCKSKACTHASRSIATSNACKGKSGGLRKGGGRGKHGWHKGYWCDSSWELAYVIFNLDNQIHFERNQKSFEYVFEDKRRKFYPDFILDDGTYVEIKGYDTLQFNAKESQFIGNLKVLRKSEMKNIIDYVVNKHGSDFIKLFDNINHMELKLA